MQLKCKSAMPLALHVLVLVDVKLLNIQTL